MLHQNIIPGFNGKRPITPMRVSAKLAASAVSVWPLADRAGQVNDYNRANIISFAAGGASPTWRDRTAGGQCLTFDGGDSATSVITGAPSAYPFWIACSYVFDSAGTAVAMAIGNSTAGTQQARLGLDASGNSVYLCRVTDAGTAVTLNGTTFSVGQLIHAAAISRSATDHTLVVNGRRFTSATNIGSTFTGFDAAIFGGTLTSGGPSSRITGGVYWGAFGTGDPGDEFFVRLTSNPWAMLHAQPSTLRWLGSVSGTAYAASLAESGSAADAVAALLALLGGASESGAASDTPGGLLILAGGLAETGSSSDTTGGAGSLGGGVSESGSLVDTAGALVVFTGGLIETLTAQDLYGSGAVSTAISLEVADALAGSASVSDASVGSVTLLDSAIGSIIVSDGLPRS